MELIFESYIAGSKYYNTSQMKSGPVQLEWEPTNEHDPHAIKIIQSGIHIGYIPRAVNRLVKHGCIARIEDRMVYGEKRMVLVVEMPDFAIPKFLDKVDFGEP